MAAPPIFEEQLQSSLQDLRQSLIELFDVVQLDSSTPYPASKRLGLNKNLVWRISKVIHATEPAEMIQHLPGASGMEILLAAFAKAGANPGHLAKVRQAMDSLNSTVEFHSGDRRTLKLMLDGTRQEEALEESCKLAYQGNSGIWGVRARVRASTFMVAPSVDAPERLDLALVAGLHGFERLRPGTAWPIINRNQFDADRGKLHPTAGQPIDPSPLAPEGLPLMVDFCSQPLPELRKRISESQLTYELAPGPVGRAASLDVVFGDIDRTDASPWRDQQNRRAEFHANILLPARAMHLDLLVHRDVPMEQEPEFELVGRVQRPAGPHGTRQKEDTLPVRESARFLGEGGGALATPLMPSYPRMIAHAMECLNWEMNDFRTWRVVIKHPPMPSTGVISWALPERPA